MMRFLLLVLLCWRPVAPEQQAAEQQAVDAALNNGTASSSTATLARIHGALSSEGRSNLLSSRFDVWPEVSGEFDLVICISVSQRESAHIALGAARNALHYAPTALVVLHVNAASPRGGGFEDNMKAVAADSGGRLLIARLRVLVEWGRGSILLSHLVAVLTATSRARLLPNATVLIYASNMRFSKCGLEKHVATKKWHFGMREVEAKVEPRKQPDEAAWVSTVGKMDGPWRICNAARVRIAREFVNSTRVHWRLFFSPEEVSSALKLARPQFPQIHETTWSERDKRVFAAHCYSFLRNLPQGRLISTRHEGAFYPLSHVLDFAAAVDKLDGWLDLARETLPTEELYLQSWAVTKGLLPRDRVGRRPICAIKRRGNGHVGSLAEADCLTQHNRAVFAFKRAIPSDIPVREVSEVPVLKQLNTRMLRHKCPSDDNDPQLSLCTRQAEQALNSRGPRPSTLITSSK